MSDNRPVAYSELAIRPSATVVGIYPTATWSRSSTSSTNPTPFVMVEDQEQTDRS
jgi:hypothetical protein